MTGGYVVLVRRRECTENDRRVCRVRKREGMYREVQRRGCEEETPRDTRMYTEETPECTEKRL